MVRHFRTLLDLTPDELRALLDRGIELKRLRITAQTVQPLAGKSVALVFEKSSTRTRVSFEVGVKELGGHPISLMSRDIQLGRGEPLSDTARMLSGYCHAVMYRCGGHERIEELARHSRIPVINGLSDKYHPCQLLADLMTLTEEFGTDWSALKVAWIGDGNNMAHSWINAARLLGFELRLACPEGYAPAADVVADALSHGARITIVKDPKLASEGVHVVTTDVWASMGQEEEGKERLKAFAGFGVDQSLMARADKSAIFLHCLPAHRGEEVAAEVIDGASSRVWRQAENRLHGQKALLEFLVGA